MIRIKELYKSFGKLEVLKGITMDVHEGEVISIIGPSGSGKSTLLRCMNRLEERTSGDILFHNESIYAKGADPFILRQKMGMVFQHFNLFPHLTVRKNITIAPM